MIREQQLIKDLVDKLGDELDEFISNFYLCNFWVYKENEVVVDKTFKKIVSIIADYNLTTANEILESTYKTIDSDNTAMLYVLHYMCDNYLDNGSDNLLNRILVFCYSLFEFSKGEDRKATEILREVYEFDLVVTKETKWTKFKYFIGFSNEPFERKFQLKGIGLIALLKGLSVTDTVEYILELM